MYYFHIIIEKDEQETKGIVDGATRTAAILNLKYRYGTIRIIELYELENPLESEDMKGMFD